MKSDTPLNMPANSTAKRMSDVHARPSSVVFEEE
jgi:hypothetical protein